MLKSFSLDQKGNVCCIYASTQWKIFKVSWKYYSRNFQQKNIKVNKYCLLGHKQRYWHKYYSGRKITQKISLKMTDYNQIFVSI